MANLPTVAIIGRPNTGKSTLFNRLVGKRKAIVSDIPGTTRDQIASRVENEELDYLLIDTGGIGGGSEDIDLEDDVEQQSLLALENADLILFTVNSREQLTKSDYEVVELLRKKRKKHVAVITVLTKCDQLDFTLDEHPEFYELGIADEIVPVSAAHAMGLDELTQKIIGHLKALHFQRIEKKELDAPRIAIIGKPNVGKSSLVNGLMSEPQRESSALLVSPIAGTTRDATDTIIEYHGKPYIYIDTAGFKRKKSMEGDLEMYATFRSIQAIEESDICVLLVDASQPVTKQDKKLAGLAMSEGKGLIILLNKMDLLDSEAKKEALAKAKIEFSFCKFASMIPCSTKTRDGILKIFDQIEIVQINRSRRISTKDLLNWYTEAIYGQQGALALKSKHITQAEDVPPTFVVFVKDPKKVQLSHLKFLENRMRSSFGFEGTPIRWITKSSNREDR